MGEHTTSTGRTQSTGRPKTSGVYASRQQLLDKIWFLREQTTCKISEISRHTGVSVSAITKILDSNERIASVQEDVAPAQPPIQPQCAENPIMSNTDPLAGLFTDRIPEAAARQVALVLAWLTECQLATLEELQARKSTSRSDLARQSQICHTAVLQCADLGIGPGVSGLRGHGCPRLSEALLGIQAAGQREEQQRVRPSQPGC